MSLTDSLLSRLERCEEMTEIVATAASDSSLVERT
jgi:hypothetical protein